ncbi:hypothetical protein M422DRAFT_43211 [Sphaerobolus stellatus SS14]|nr:hypothetical protein M422DRAFT_43211 [Sphaerobolus stellatus SS14]
MTPAITATPTRDSGGALDSQYLHSLDFPESLLPPTNKRRRGSLKSMARDNKRVRVQALTSERDAARARVRVLEEKLVNVALEGLARDGDVFEGYHSSGEQPAFAFKVTIATPTLIKSEPCNKDIGHPHLDLDQIFTLISSLIATDF